MQLLSIFQHRIRFWLLCLQFASRIGLLESDFYQRDLDWIWFDFEQVEEKKKEKEKEQEDKEKKGKNLKFHHYILVQPPRKSSLTAFVLINPRPPPN